MLKTLTENLKNDCFAKTITPVGATLNLVKLYDTICDACEENSNFDWYSLGDVFAFNSEAARPKGIICHNCEEKCNTKGCIISLIIDKDENTRFCKIDKMEIK